MADDLTSMNVSLPGSMREFVREQMQAGGYANASEFIRQLIRAEQQRLRKKLEALLLEGLDSGPATEMTEKDWKDLRARVRTNAAAVRAPARRKAG